MPVEQDHPEFDDHAYDWRTVRDVIRGKRALVEGNDRYLMRLEEMEPTEYEHYQRRAEFFAATGRAHDGLIGLIFRKDPTFEVPTSLDDILEDVDLLGTSLRDYSEEIVSELMKVGRCGSVFDFSEQLGRPFLTFYEAEAIRNWRISHVAGRPQLTLLVLEEESEDESLGSADPTSGTYDDEFDPPLWKQRRVFDLFGEGANLSVRVRIFRELITRVTSGPEGRVQEKRSWEQVGEERFPTVRGEPLREIPFVIHSTTGKMSLGKAPLLGIAELNVDHFRLSAEHRHAMFFTANPVPWVTGWDGKGQRLTIGSSRAWTFESQNVKVGMLEYQGQGLETYERKLERKEAQMAILGARLLDDEKTQNETATAFKIKSTGETATLTKLVRRANAGVRAVLRGMLSFTGEEEADLSFEINRDFVSAHLDPSMITALLPALLQGAISPESWVHQMHQGEILHPDADVEEEIARIRLLGLSGSEANGGEAGEGE